MCSSAINIYYPLYFLILIAGLFFFGGFPWWSVCIEMLHFNKRQVRIWDWHIFVFLGPLCPIGFLCFCEFEDCVSLFFKLLISLLRFLSSCISFYFPCVFRTATTHTHTHQHIYTHLHTQTHTYTHTHKHKTTHIHTNTHTRTHTHEHTHTYTSLYSFIPICQ